MSAADPVASKPAEPAALRGVSSQQGRQSFRARYGRNWLLRLAYPPPRLHRGPVERLARGEAVTSVARWILRHPNRGGMSNVTCETSMRRYVSVLAEEVRKRKLLDPAPTMDDLAASGMVAPAPVSRKPGAKFRNLEDYLDDVIRNFNRELMAIGAAKSNWEALERLRRAEEVMGEENPIPLHGLGAGRAKVSGALIQALDFLRKNEESQVLKRKVLLSIGELADDPSGFAAATIPHAMPEEQLFQTDPPAPHVSAGHDGSGEAPDGGAWPLLSRALCGWKSSSLRPSDGNWRSFRARRARSPQRSRGSAVWRRRPIGEGRTDCKSQPHAPKDLERNVVSVEERRPHGQHWRSPEGSGTAIRARCRSTRPK